MRGVTSNTDQVLAVIPWENQVFDRWLTILSYVYTVEWIYLNFKNCFGKAVYMALLLQYAKQRFSS